MRRNVNIAVKLPYFRCVRLRSTNTHISRMAIMKKQDLQYSWF